MTAPPVAAASTRGRQQGTRRGGRRRRRWLDWMAVPTMAILALVVAYPIIRAALLSFYDYSLITGDAGSSFTGLDNYRTIAGDTVLWESVRNSVFFTGVSLVGAATIGLVLAFATENLDGPWRVLRAVLLTPWAIPIIVVAFLFRFLYLDRGGVINYLLLDAGIVDAPVRWLSSSEWALTSVTIANIWLSAPFFLLVFTAGLRAVPNEVVEAARIDRAKRWTLIWQIKMPYLRGPAIVAVLIMTIQNLNQFPIIWAMTQGGPGYSSSTLTIYLYRLAFTRFDLGYASAVGVAWLLLLVALAWSLLVRPTRKESR